MFCHTPESISNGHLRFQRKQKSWGQAINVLHTRGVVDRRMELREIFVNVGYSVPEETKEEPTPQEGCDEDGHLVSPFEIKHSCPNVHKEYKPRLCPHIAKFYVAPSIFGNQPCSSPRMPKKASDEPFPKMFEHSFCHHLDLGNACRRPAVSRLETRAPESDLSSSSAADWCVTELTARVPTELFSQCNRLTSWIARVNIETKPRFLSTPKSSQIFDVSESLYLWSKSLSVPGEGAWGPAGFMSLWVSSDCLPPHLYATALKKHSLL